MQNPSGRKKPVRHLAIKTFNLAVAFYLGGLLVYIHMPDRPVDNPPVQPDDFPVSSVLKAHKVGQVRQFIGETELFSQGTFSGVSLELDRLEDDVRIIVRGRVVSETEEEKKDVKFLLNMFLVNSRPPVKCINKVQYVLMPPDNLEQNQDSMEAESIQDSIDRQARRYVDVMHPLVHEVFPGVNLDVISDKLGVRIRVKGTVCTDKPQAGEQTRELLEAILVLGYPPVEFLDEVQYQRSADSSGDGIPILTDNTSEPSILRESMEQQVRDFIAEMQPQVHCDFPHVELGLINEDEQIKVLVSGQIVSDTKQEAELEKLALGYLFALWKPPFDFKDDIRCISRDQVQTYITKTMDRYELPDRGISMDMLETKEGLRIEVLGEVPDQDSLIVLQSFFEHPITNPDLPVPLEWNVKVSHNNLVASLNDERGTKLNP